MIFLTYAGLIMFLCVQFFDEPSRSHAPPGKEQDFLVRRYFAYCDYSNGLNIGDIVMLLSNFPNARILVTGGLFNYDDYQLLKKCQDAGLNADLVGNYNPFYPKRDFVLVNGCVPLFARQLSIEIIKNGRKSMIYIDPKTAVSFGYQFDPNVLYLIHAVGTISQLNSIYTVVKRVPRDIIFSNI